MERTDICCLSFMVHFLCGQYRNSLLYCSVFPPLSAIDKTKLNQTGNVLRDCEGETTRCDTVSPERQKRTGSLQLCHSFCREYEFLSPGWRYSMLPLRTSPAQRFFIPSHLALFNEPWWWTRVYICDYRWWFGEALCCYTSGCTLFDCCHTSPISVN